MQEIKSQKELLKNKILIAVATRGLIPTRFMVSIVALQEYFYEWVIKNKREDVLSLTTQQGYLIDEQRNALIEVAIKNEQTHILFLDDDMTFPADMIVRMIEDIEENEDQGVEAITGLYCLKSVPYSPHIYTVFNKKIKAFQISASFPTRSIFRVVGAGMGCCLIKTEVFKRIDKPWFLMGGEIDGAKGVGEDLYFCLKAKPLMLCDSRLQCAHWKETPIQLEDYIKSNGLNVDNKGQIQGSKEAFEIIGKKHLEKKSKK